MAKWRRPGGPRPAHPWSLEHLRSAVRWALVAAVLPWGVPACPASAEDAHWAFVPPRDHAPPPVALADWPATDVDRFVLARLEAAGLGPGPEADRTTLLRRASLDLTGLPPTPADLRAFLADDAPGAFARVVDRLLATPDYGACQARHWLDVARYAESTGKTVNFAYPHAWRYRDWVIAAFQADMPYDRFVRAQLAGDLLPAADAAGAAANAIATGFLAIGPRALNERSGLKFELDMVDEQIDVTTQAFLGLTVACARCHDHKVDPVPQTDYYALAGIFRSTETCYGTVPYINAQRPAPLIPLAAAAGVAPGTGPLTAAERARVEARIAATRGAMAGMDPLQRFFTAGTLSLLQARLDAHAPDGTPVARAMGVRDKRPGPEPRRPGAAIPGPGGFTADGSRRIGDSPVFDQGAADAPRPTTVPRGTLTCLPLAGLAIPADSSGRRELAEWIASPANPLTARVMVNRVWLHLFGRGLVPTPEDFGRGGRPPSHPELLDALACRFMADGWSVKRLVRHLVSSRVYAQSSAARPEALERDPDNELLWRSAPRRLDAEVLRDAILAVSGRLDPAPPTVTVVATVGEGPVSQPRRGGDLVLQALLDPDHVHRSIYLPVIRDMPHPFLAAFDGADPNLITAQRQRTTVPTQALVLLNDPFVLRAAEATAALVAREAAGTTDGDLVTAAAVRILARPPTAAEVAAATAFLTAWRQRADDPVADALPALCQVLLAVPEFQLRP